MGQKKNGWKRAPVPPKPPELFANRDIILAYKEKETKFDKDIKYFIKSAKMIFSTSSNEEKNITSLGKLLAENGFKYEGMIKPEGKQIAVKQNFSGYDEDNLNSGTGYQRGLE